MFALVITTTWQVLSRYVGGAPQTWPTDIAAYGLVFLTFIGMGVLLRDDGHICVDVLYTRLPRLVQCILDIIMDFIGVATVFTVTWFALKLDADYAAKNTFLIGSVFYTPKVYIFTFIPVGLAITGIEYIRRLIKHVLRLVKGDAERNGERGKRKRTE